MPAEVPSFSAIREKLQNHFSKRACLWQLKVTDAFLQNDHDIICIAGTGMGKTLAFWSPLALNDMGILIVVTPLNQLGEQSISFLEKAGIQSISISAETASMENFCGIEDSHYCGIITSPEQLMKPGGEFEKLLRNINFASKLIGIIFDEAHCIVTWGEFRPEYKELERLRYILPCQVPFMIASAMLTSDALRDICRLLHLRSENLVTIHVSTDCPNIKIRVHKIKYSLASYADLAFLIPTGMKLDDPPPPKFLIFFDSIQDGISTAKYLRARLPPDLREKVKWFNSDMTTEFKEAEVTNFIAGDTWGLCTTEAFGMGMDVPDVALVIQWRASCKLSALWQRFGRAARDHALEGTALLFVEKEYFDDVRKDKHKHQERKNKATSAPDSQPAAKRRVINSLTTVDIPHPEEGDGAQATSSGSAENTPIVTDVQLRELMRPASTSERASRQKKEKELDRAMDLLINANYRGVGCRRKVFNIQFDNESADSSHLISNASDAEGCSRCAPIIPKVCCDIHHPLAFSLFNPIIVPQLPRLPIRSRLAKYTMGPQEFKLCEALEDWRDQKTVEIYGRSHLIDLGPTVVMGDSVLDQIVDCAHFQKIKIADDLRKETHWSVNDNLAREVIAIIHRIIPISLYTTAPLKQRPLPTTVNAPNSGLGQHPAHVASNGPPAGVKKVQKCSACGQAGHNKRGRVCPMHPSQIPSAAEKENVYSLPPNTGPQS
ncbi:P-loop containing nucleoside triphosphate hydrolase protein [Suillus ampliporus]|nr:P-loop containing nucleoside triphosphate hydrolase protein [Suillus ampliporus]